MPVALIYALTLCLAAPPASAAASTPETSEATLFAEAKKEYNKGHYLAAAASFESLWEAHQKSKYLHLAGLAWATAGEDARAIILWRRHLKLSSASEQELQETESYLVGALDRTTGVTIRAEPGPAIQGARLELSRDASQANPLQIPLADVIDPTRPDTAMIHLEPGTWTVVLHPGTPRYTPARTALEVNPKAPKLDLHLTLELAMSTLNLQVTPPEALAAGVSVTLHDADGQSADISLDVTEERSSITLPVGTWYVHAESPAAAPITDTVAVALEQPTPLALAFQITPIRVDEPPPPPPQEEPEPKPKLRHPRLALGLGVSSAVSALTGAVLAGLGETRITAATRDTNLPPGCTAQAAKGRYRSCLVEESRELIANGGLFLGGAVGLGITATAAHLGLRRRRWYAPLVLGIASAAGGGAWYFTSLGSDPLPGLSLDEPFLSSQQVSTLRQNYYPSSLLVGLGSGLIIGSVAGLIASRRKGSHVSSLRLRSLPLRGGIAVSF